MKRNAPTKDGRLDQAILLAFDVAAGGDGEVAVSGDNAQELRSVRDTVSRLAFASSKTPRPGLKHELLSSLRRTPPKNPQVWKSWTADAGSGVHVVRSNEGDWQSVVQGVHVKRLFADPVRDSVTMLIRMEPGSEWPAHRHAGDEECLVLEGDVQVGDVTLQAGDYQCARTSSIHDVTRTVNGCLLLIVSSMHDQLLA